MRNLRYDSREMRYEPASRFGHQRPREAPVPARLAPRLFAMLRYRADVKTLIFVTIYFALVAVQWVYAPHNLALAIPLLLAAVLGGLRVSGDYGDSRQAARSAQQVTIIQPAVDYLTASETAMVAAQSDSAASQGDLIDAISDISTNAETLVEARDGPARYAKTSHQCERQVVRPGSQSQSGG